MTLSERLSELVRACFSGLWVQSFEQDDAVVEIARLCRQQHWSLATWDIDRGLSIAGRDDGSNTAISAPDPLAAIKSIGSLATPDGAALMVLRNFHRFLGSVEVMQALDTAISAGKQNRTIILVLSPVTQIPTELERQFVVLEHDLPDRDQLQQIARTIATEPGELPDGDAHNAVLDSAVGLTRVEAENAFSLSLIRHGRVTPDVMWELKAQTLKKSGLMTIYRGGETFADLGGLEAVKAFCRRSLARRPSNSLARPRGVLLLGVSGTGKSAFCKALGNEVGRPTLMLDIGALMGSLVGMTEERTRQALRIADAMAPCIVFIDEIEKGLSGVQASGQTDSGVSARMFGTLLSYLNDHESDVYFICSANDVSKLPPEFTRAERFDAIFFLDLPGSREKEQIWRLYLERFGLDPAQKRPADRDFTGAEIRACCRLAALLGVSLVEAAANIVAVAVTADESVERLRNWAAGRCLSADRPGIYSRVAASPGKAGRSVHRGDPSVN
jgi:ATPase family associated with various cellular activities (AAA)